MIQKRQGLLSMMIRKEKKIQNYLDKENYSFVLYKKCYDNYSLLDYLSKLII